MQWSRCFGKRLSLTHGGCNFSSDDIRRATKRVIVEMSISLRCFHICMSKQLSNYWKSQSATCTDARKRMPQVVNSNTFQTRSLTDQFPWPLEIRSRFFRIVARNDESADAGNCRQNVDSWTTQYDRLFARLGIRKKQQAALQIDVLPLQVQDFTQSCSSEQKQSQGSRSMWPDYCQAAFRSHRDVFCVRRCSIYRPRDTGRFSFANGRTQPLQFLGSKKSFTALRPIFFDAPRRIYSFFHNPSFACKSVHAAEQSQGCVRAMWRFLEAGVQLGYSAPRDLVRARGPKLRFQDSIDDVFRPRCRARLSFRDHVFGEKNICQCRQGKRRTLMRFVCRRVAALCHSSEHLLCGLPRLLRSEFTEGSQRDAFLLHLPAASGSVFNAPGFCP